MIETDTEINELDLESRALCPDENCIGVLSADGRCKVCGRTGSLPAPGPGREPFSVSPELAGGPADTHMNRDDSDSSHDPGDESRELCPDESCIGLLGPSGSCKICGRRREPG